MSWSSLYHDLVLLQQVQRTRPPGHSVMSKVPMVHFEFSAVFAAHVAMSGKMPVQPPGTGGLDKSQPQHRRPDTTHFEA